VANVARILVATNRGARGKVATVTAHVYLAPLFHQALPAMLRPAIGFPINQFSDFLSVFPTSNRIEHAHLKAQELAELG